MEIIARVLVEYTNKRGMLEDCTIQFKLINKGVGVWEEIKLKDSECNGEPNFSFSSKGRLHLVDSKKGWFEDGVGRLKFKFQEGDLSNYIGK